MHSISFPGTLTTTVSAFADDITVFLSCLKNIAVVKAAVTEYKRIPGAKVNFEKSEGLWLGAWTGTDTLPRPISILGVWSGLGLQLERNWSKVQAKVDTQLGIRLQKEVVLKRQGGGMHLVHLLLAPGAATIPHQFTLSKIKGQWSVDRSAFNIRGMGVWVSLI